MAVQVTLINHNSHNNGALSFLNNPDFKRLNCYKMTKGGRFRSKHNRCYSKLTSSQQIKNGKTKICYTNYLWHSLKKNNSNEMDVTSLEIMKYVKILTRDNTIERQTIVFDKSIRVKSKVTVLFRYDDSSNEQLCSATVKKIFFVKGNSLTPYVRVQLKKADCGNNSKTIFDVPVCSINTID